MTSAQIRRQRPPWPAWLLFGVTIFGALAMFALFAAGCGDQVLDGSPADRVGFFVILASQFFFGMLGMVILYKQPGHNIGWLSLVIGALDINHSAQLYSVCGAHALPASQFLAWIGYWTMPVTVVAFFVLLPMLFPDGHFLSSRWRTFTVIGCMLHGLAVLAVSLVPGPMIWNGMSEGATIGPDNPMALPLLPASMGPVLNAIISVVFFALAMGAIASLVVRYRRSQGESRQQLKWLAYYFAMAFGVQMIFFELPGPFFYPEIFDSVAYAIILLIVFLGFPTVIGIAVLRYRLYDIDIIIRRTLVYALVTAALLAIYFGSVILLQRFFVISTGQESTVAIVVSTLLIAALFNPLRNRVQALIDRRFYRRKYDAQRTLARFGAVARDEVNLESLQTEFLAVVEQTVQPSALTLWLKEERP